MKDSRLIPLLCIYLTIFNCLYICYFQEQVHCLTCGGQTENAWAKTSSKSFRPTSAVSRLHWPLVSPVHQWAPFRRCPFPQQKWKVCVWSVVPKRKLLGLHVNLSTVEWYWMAVHDKIVSFWTYASLWEDSARGDCTNNIDDILMIQLMRWFGKCLEQWCGRQKKHEESSFNALSPSVPLSMNSADDNTVNSHLLMANNTTTTTLITTSNAAAKTASPKSHHLRWELPGRPNLEEAHHTDAIWQSARLPWPQRSWWVVLSKMFK